MEFTYLDYFNYYLKEFCNEIISNFPDYEKNVVANYRELLESKQSKNDLYVKYFVSKVNDYMDQICNKDTELFVASNWYNNETNVQGSLYLLEGVDFISLWNSSFNNDTNKQAIWKYLQLLVLLGRHIVPNKTEILEILNNVGGQVYAPAKVEKTLHGDEDNLDETGNTPDIFGLGNIAGLASMMGIGSGEMPDLSSIVKTLGDALGNINIDEITKQMEEAQREAEEKLDDNEQSENTENTSNLETTTDTSNNTSNDTHTDTTISNDTSNDTHTDTTTSTDKSTTTNTKNNEGLSSTTTNLFADLAKEMTSTFDFSSLENEQPANMGDVFSKFLSGDNPAKLMGLVSKFGSKIQKEVASGNLNQGDLLRDTQKMMSGLSSGDTSKLKKQAQNIAKSNPALVQQMQQMQRQSSNDTRSRLQAKLASKKANQEQ